MRISFPKFALTMFVLLGQPAGAATIELSTSAYAQVYGFGASDTDSVSEPSNPFPDFYFSTSLVDQSNSLQSSSARGRAYANSTEGLLRADTLVAGVTADGLGDASASASARITETKSYTGGSGWVTAYLKLDGWWNIAGPTNSWQVQARVSAGTASDGININAISDGNSGSFADRIFSVSQFVDARNRQVSVDFSWSLFAQQLSTMGFLRFDNTAKIFIEEADELVGTFSDPLFLSDPAYTRTDSPTPVPLPASSILLVFGLSLLPLFRRLRS